MTAEQIKPAPKLSLLEFFGSELRRVRIEAGESQQWTASAAYTTQSMISKVEHAKQVPSGALDTVFQTGGHFGRLYPLVLAYAYPAWFLPYVEMERSAVSIRTFESQVLPGLLQTEEYARLVLAAGRPKSLVDILAARMSRQSVLEGEQRPRAWFVLDEQALRRPIGGADVMRPQLERVLEAANDPRTVVQVVPERIPAHPGLEGPFTVLTVEEAPDDVLYVDGFSQGRMSVDGEEVAHAHHAYDLLRSYALPHEESCELIGEYMKGLAK
jgi:transcriptional regulator with XRE-family HTH domain